jgi:hypothetical protein
VYLVNWHRNLGTVICSEGDGGVKLFKSFILLSPLFLASCPYSARYCEVEGRIIPEAEWQARALVALRKFTMKPESEKLDPWQKMADLPKDMKLFVNSKISSGASDNQIEEIFTEYITKNPECCQINYGNESQFIEWHYEDPPSGKDAFHPTATMIVGYNATIGVNACAREIHVWNRG